MSKNIENIINETQSHKNNIMQIAAFELISTNSVFGINVSKVKSFVGIKDCVISRTGKNGVYEGFVSVQNDTYPLINMEKWLGFDSVPLEKYNVVILTEFNQTKLAFLAKKIKRIYNKSSEELERSDFLEGKITYIVRLEKEENNNINNLDRLKKNLEKQEKKDSSEFRIKRVNLLKDNIKDLEDKIKKEKTSDKFDLCLVIDVESLLFDISEKERSKFSAEHIKIGDNINFKKRVLVAEDSKTSQKIISNVLKRIGVDFNIFSNGKEIIDYCEKSDINNVGLIITDLEMPEKDGYQVVQYFKSKNPEIFIVVNSSMSNEGVRQKVVELGANDFIEKTNPDKILELVEKTCI